MFYIITIVFVKSFLLYLCLPELSENRAQMTNIEAKLYPLLSVKNNRFNKKHSTIRYKLTLHSQPSLLSS